MTETLLEYCDWRGLPLRTDRAAGVIRGVKILGLRSRNGRYYPPETLRQAAKLYEEAKVNVNHSKSPLGQPRDYQDRIGVIRNVRLEPDEGLFADFYFNPKHALAEQLLWDAEHAPENVGFSHNVEARIARRDDQLVVEAITRVHSVDLVADPATTRGLFESQDGLPGTHTADGGQAATLADLTLEVLKKHRPDLLQAALAEQLAEHQAALRRLQAELEEAHAAIRLAERRKRICQLLTQYGLPTPEQTDPAAQVIISEQFLAELLAAEDEARLRQLVDERARLVRTLSRGLPGAAATRCPPLSRDQRAVDALPPLDVESFVRAIT